VTEHPTAEWTTQQLVESGEGEDAPEIIHLLCNGGGLIGHVFERKVKALGLTNIVTLRASPWRNGFVKLVNRTLGRE